MDTLEPLVRSSTLPPPPLETAATGTRALQRFDIGAARRKVVQAPLEEELPDEIEIIFSTLRMPVSERIRLLPVVDSYAEAAPARAPAPRSVPDDVAWALTSWTVLVAMSSLASAMVYVLLFP